VGGILTAIGGFVDIGDLVTNALVGSRFGLANLIASFLVTLLTFTAEIGGIALSIELVTSVNYLLWVPLVGLAVWLIIWRVKFSALENVFGLLGLALIVFAVALWKLNPDWGNLLHQVVAPHKPHKEGLLPADQTRRPGLLPVSSSSMAWVAAPVFATVKGCY
jgi:Mn2+/Fe2+ NRAMP family transporter